MASTPAKAAGLVRVAGASAPVCLPCQVHECLPKHASLGASHDKYMGVSLTASPHYTLGSVATPMYVSHAAVQDSKYTQQALLEENNTIVRLSTEKELLASTLKYYRAATALEGVFGETGSTTSEVPQPPPGGPD